MARFMLHPVSGELHVCPVSDVGVTVEDVEDPLMAGLNLRLHLLIGVERSLLNV